MNDTEKIDQALYCCVCRNQVPADRAKRKSFSCVTCSDDCYSTLRTVRRNLRRQKGWYVPKSKRAQFERWLAESTKVPAEAQQSLGMPMRSAQQLPMESSEPNV